MRDKCLNVSFFFLSLGIMHAINLSSFDKYQHFVGEFTIPRNRNLRIIPFFHS